MCQWLSDEHNAVPIYKQIKIASSPRQDEWALAGDAWQHTVADRHFLLVQNAVKVVTTSMVGVLKAIAQVSNSTCLQAIEVVCVILQCAIMM